MVSRTPSKTKWSSGLFDVSLSHGSRWGANLGAIFLALMVLLNFYEVIARYAFGRPTSFMWEILVYGDIGLVYLALGYCWRQNAHINVDVVVTKLRRGVQEHVRLWSTILTLICLAVLTSQAWSYEYYMYETGRRAATVLATPRYIPYIMLALGVTLFSLELLASFMKEIKSLISGRRKGPF